MKNSAGTAENEPTFARLLTEFGRVLETPGEVRPESAREPSPTVSDQPEHCDGTVFCTDLQEFFMECNAGIWQSSSY